MCPSFGTGSEIKNEGEEIWLNLNLNVLGLIHGEHFGS